MVFVCVCVLFCTQVDRLELAEAESRRLGQQLREARSSMSTLDSVAAQEARRAEALQRELQGWVQRLPVCSLLVLLSCGVVVADQHPRVRDAEGGG